MGDACSFANNVAVAGTAPMIKFFDVTLSGEAG